MRRRFLATIMALSLCLALAAPAQKASAAYTPVYVTDENGTTCTGDFDRLTSGQIIFFPAEMMSNNEVYPAIVWANGTMCAPALYYSLLSKIAAGGYIVVTNTDMMAADGTSQVASVDYIIAENSDPDSFFYGRVNVNAIGAAGHSQGGRSAVNAAVLDSRIKCVLSIAGSNFTSEAKKLTTPTFFVTGTLDTIVLSSLWVKPAYNACKGHAVYASLKNALHTTCCTNPDKYVGYALKWFDGNLKNDANAMNAFAARGQLSKDSAWTGFTRK